jgi:hypothetical protein
MSEQRGDGGIVSRRSGRHAAPAVESGTSVAGIRGRVVAVLAWLFERRLHVLLVTVSIATVAMIIGAVALIAFTGESRPGGQLATAVDVDRPTPTDPGVASSRAPILPSPAPPSSVSPVTPAPPSEGERADPATDAPLEPPAEPMDTEPRPAAVPDGTNQPGTPGEPDAPGEPGAPDETGGPEEPDTTEDCDEHAPLLQLILGPRCP